MHRVFVNSFLICVCLSFLCKDTQLFATQALLLDQQHIPSPLISSSYVRHNIIQAQTFTVGRTGTLARLDVIAESVAAYGNDLKLDIRGTVAGVPSDTVLQTVNVGALPAEDSGGIYTQFPLNVSVTSGQILAFVFRMQAGDGEINLRGRSSVSVDPYSRGMVWTRGNTFVNSGNWYANGNDPRRNYDIGFRTHVLANVPEPSTALLAFGVMANAALTRRPRKGEGSAACNL